MNAPGAGHGSPDPAAASREILGRCAALGFALAGIADARASAHADSFRAWIDAGKQGGMSYLAEELDRRLDPRVLVPGAASVLCVADRYATAARTGASPARARSPATRAARTTTR